MSLLSMSILATKNCHVLLCDNALQGNAVTLIKILRISTCKDWLLQSVVGVIGVPQSVGRSDQVVVHVHVQPLRLGEKHGHQDALQTTNGHSVKRDGSVTCGWTLCALGH